MINVELCLMFNNTWNHLLCAKKKALSRLKMLYMYKLDLVLNNQQELICHKTKTKQTLFLSIGPGSLVFCLGLIGLSWFACPLLFL